MSVTRGELEGLDREALVARAERAGVAKARILTRLELVDELLLRSATDEATKERTRGLFGRARDLLARLVERGLNKPEAADRIRSVGRPLVGRPSAPAALPTLTLAEIYVAQGYRERAIETLDRVLSAEPEHAAARALLTRLRDAAFPVPTPKMAPENDLEDAKDGSPEEPAPPPPAVASVASAPSSRPDPLPAEPSYMLDDSPLPQKYDVDECVAIAMDPTTLYVYWEVRGGTLEGLRWRSTDPEVALRIVVVEPTWNGPRTSVRDHDVRALVGELFINDLPPGSVARVALGVRSEREPRDFLPVAHSPPVELPPSSPALLAGTKIVRWTTQGAVPVVRDDADAGALASMSSLIARLRKEAISSSRPTPSTPRGPSAAPTAPASLGGPAPVASTPRSGAGARAHVAVAAGGASEEFAGGPPYRP